MMQPFAYSTRTAARASGVYLAYGAGMGVLCITTLMLSSALIQTVAAGITEAQLADERKLSRVEMRLEQMAKTRQRVAKTPHRVVLAYAVPKMHPMQLAKAMDRTEHISTYNFAQSGKLAQVAALDTDWAGGRDPLRVARGPAVAGFVASASAEPDDGDDLVTIVAETVSVEPAEAKRERRSLRSTAKSVAKSKNSEKKKPKWVASEPPFGLEFKTESVRLADTPGAIIRRQLGGTT